MPQALIALQLLGTNFWDRRDFCNYAVNEEQCVRLFLSGWGLFVGSIVGACVFHWLTQKVPFMHGWWERASTPIGFLIITSGVVAVVLWIVAENV